MKKEAKRLRSIFKEGSDVTELMLPRNEAEELKKIFYKISTIYSNNYQKLMKTLSRDEYELIGDICVHNFLYEVLKKKYSIKIYKFEYKEDIS